MEYSKKNKIESGRPTAAKNPNQEDEMSTLPKTYGEAMAAGWHDTDRTLERGYVSRKSNINDAPIHIAGGNRAGQYYVLVPSCQSTEYCTRQYLAQNK